MLTRSPGLSSSYCLVVSSCDAYDDCWTPFFTLLAKYWQPFEHSIYLNTETQAFTFPHLDIRCPRVELSAGRKLAWSDRLLRCLDRIPYDIVLYLQEDYFINDTVDVAMIDRLARLMQRDRISHISLVRGRRPGTPSQYEFIDQIDRRAQYRISAQAGLWRLSALKSYLRRHESVWELEWYGTRRAWRKPDSFFYVNQDYEAAIGKRVLPYRPTGVVHGRWVREVVEDLFASNDIDVDYERRGFYDRDHDVWTRKPLLIRAARRIRSIP